MIISVSRRTDIPAFFSDWFYNRIEDGYFMVRNPMNIHQVSQVEVTPFNAECLVFWTKNPSTTFIENLPILDKKGFKYYFQFTISSYAQDIEKSVPHKTEIIEKFQKLSKKIGKEKVIWRYDPVILNDKYNFDYHLKYFKYIAEKLADYTEKVIISFIDCYPKIKNRLQENHITELTQEQMRKLASTLKQIADNYNLKIESCSEKIELDDIGIPHGHCIDGDLINRICHKNYVFQKDKTQRDECGCVTSIDIGSYNTCRHNCAYCYATWNSKIPNQIDSSSPLLGTELTDLDIVNIRKVPVLKELPPELF